MKMKSIKIMLILSFIGLHIMDSYSQFEQKVTLNFSVGYIRPMGVENYTNITTRTASRLYLVDGTTETDFAYIYPYIMSNFDPGILLTGGVQFNINRRFSIAANVNYFNLWNWSYAYYYNDIDYGEYSGDWLSWDVTNEDLGLSGTPTDIVESGEDEYNLFNLGLGIAPKVYLLPGKKVNPYVFAEINANYTHMNYQDNESKVYEEYGLEPAWDPLSEMMDKSWGVGGFPGLGLDISINENIGLFVQGGYSMILLNQGDMEDAGLEPENFKTIRAEAGIKISFLKSKDF